MAEALSFSIIIPSYNQDRFIADTLENVVSIKKAAEKDFKIEILLFDNESNQTVRKIISEYEGRLDFVEIKKDEGQYDAINKGIKICRGTYWTWLNTDDRISADGFFRLAEILRKNPKIDYIYGGINYIDAEGKFLKTIAAKPLSVGSLVNMDPGIYQPGSFFKTSFCAKLGLLKSYRCCFDYEYVLRALKKNAVVHRCDFPVADFRIHEDSKTADLTTVFIREQREISRDYGRTLLSPLTWISSLRLLKHQLMPRR